MNDLHVRKYSSEGVFEISARITNISHLNEGIHPYRMAAASAFEIFGISPRAVAVPWKYP